MSQQYRRLQSRMAPGMHAACLNGRDTPKPRARGGLSLTAGSRGSRPTHSILQPSSTLWVTSKAACEG